MINALASTPRSSFTNPGVAVPAEPEIKQDEDDKDNDKDKDKDKDGKDKDQKAAADNKQNASADQQPVVSSQPQTTKKRSSMKDRVNEIMGKPVVSNQPTPRN